MQIPEENLNAGPSPIKLGKIEKKSRQSSIISQEEQVDPVKKYEERRKSSQKKYP